MHLKRLEIQGFKSFPEKTKLDFTTGITTVVGPNGSGKSNISDSIRWALGEQSAKSLRGGKMEDIIFSGTQNRRPLQFAEVSLVLDNEDKKIPAEFSEVKVTRRVYRSGEGEYFLNGINCRLKDIHELFMDTGIGKEGYSIIGQGKIDEILSAKSADRRLLFEEAAGIVKFKNRKTEAETKLERERLNLTRAEDIIGEIESQLEPLHEQSEAAKKFLSFSERLKLVQVNIFLREAESSQEKISALAQRIEELQNSIAEDTGERDNLRKLTLELKRALEEQNDGLKALEKKLASLRQGYDQKENDIRLYAEKTAHTEKDITRLRLEIEKKRDEITAKTSVRSGFEKHMASLSEKLETVNADLEGYQADFESLSGALLESENKLAEFNHRIYDKMNEISEKKNAAEKLSGLYETLESKKEQLNTEKENISEKISELSEKIHILAEKKAGIIKEKTETQNKLNFFGDELKALEVLEKGKTEELGGVYKSYNTAKARLKLLTELEEGYEGYLKSVKSILTKKKEEPERFKNILGALGSLLSVPPGFETAIETALGSHIQNIVTETEYDTKEAIEYLKANKLGRATFLPLSAIKPRPIGGIAEKLAKEKGFVGIARDLISYDAKFENIFSNILGRVIVTDNFDDALIMFKKYNYAYKIVTKGGELLNAGGAITGGDTENSGSKIFGRSREIAVLTVQTEELRIKRDSYIGLIEELRQKAASANAKSASMLESLHKINIEESALAQEETQLGTNRSAALKRKEEIKNEDEEVLKEIVNTNKAIREANSLAAETEKQLGEIKGEMLAYQTELAQSREEKDIRVKIITDLKIEEASINEKLKSTGENIKRLDEEAKTKMQEIGKSEEEIKNLSDKKASFAEASEKAAQEAERFLELIGKNEGELLTAEGEAAKTTEDIASYEEKTEEFTQRLGTVQNELTRQSAKMEQAQEEIRRLYDLMWDDYELTLNTAKQYERLDKSTRDLTGEEREIKNEIKALGNINVGAIEEFREKKERYDFLQAQRDDIIKAEEALKDLIKDLTSLMEEQFRQQLTVISHNFSIVFSEMFGGGSAGIMLTDEENILDAGIEIIAQPPGKKLQIMSLLSGGERSLTAMAVLFAILRMKPSPFCVLDEIDAALDDANVIRFTNYLKNFSHETQFILISHKKGTMVAADALYGVTMQEQGVSKLVSVNLAAAGE
ncbi:MAG: chromosome segregation protein SMC [Clostridiales bacterium]|jgi:chromosome segregation protein|nr:chromosome segregation protein SMC [Clostridiales bacterium]